MAVPNHPTGLTTRVFKNRVEIRWVKNLELDVVGYNIYNSTTSGGGMSGYVKLNNVLIDEYIEVDRIVASSSEVVTEVGGTRTTTTVEQLTDQYIFGYTHENLTEAVKQYYVITAVSNLGEESSYSIEVYATPFVITTQIVNEPIRTFNDVSLDYIATLLQREPKLDVKPGTVTRQLHVDPNSQEFAYAYIRDNFRFQAQSFLTLMPMDDADGDGVSDPVANSTYKTNLKAAYFFTTDAQVQSLIDFAFDKLAANNNTFRGPALKSTTIATFYTESIPTKDIVIPFNQEISTVPTTTQPAIRFITLSSGVISVANINNYYNTATKRYELDIDVEAVDAGADGNVNANTLINTTLSGVKVTNKSTAFGGRDVESNADLAARAMLAFVGLDVGTSSGYKKTATGVPNVEGVIIVEAGDKLMQRDYDDVRHKHVFGKVDVFIKGGVPVQTEETVGFLFDQKIDDAFSVIDVIDMIIRTSNADVSVSHPIFSVEEIRNASRARDYDLTGNWTIFKNSIAMVKRTEVSVSLLDGIITFVTPLSFGDVISARYDYKSLVSSETIIDPALGGEVNFNLANWPVAKNSYTIYRNNVALVEGTQYTLQVSNGFLQLPSPGLSPGDKLTTTYKYVINVPVETVISSAAGGETTATLANVDVVEAMFIKSDGISIDLNQYNEINASVGMALIDVIEGTYRYRDSSPIILLNQPVDSIVSIVGSISGELTDNLQYKFNKIDDILLEGNSTKAQRSVQILYSGGLPTGDVLSTQENVVLVNNEFKQLGQKGIDIVSIIVRDNTNVYVKNVDYLIKPEGEGLNIQLARSVTSTIPNGGTVVVSYDYGELLTITYNVNPLIKIVQDDLEVVRHVTADVLVKGVLETKIDLTFSVVLYAGEDSTIAKDAIRTAISNEINKHVLGKGISQSDIVRVIESVESVDSVLIPLTKMVKANGTQINREELNVPFTFYQSNVVSSYTTGPNVILNKTLGSNAADGFYEIFEDDRKLTLVSSATSVDDAAGQGFISSQGEIIVSTIDSDLPNGHNYTVSYVVNGETGAKDIRITSLEYISMGELIISTSY